LFYQLTPHHSQLSSSCLDCTHTVQDVCGSQGDLKQSKITIKIYKNSQTHQK